MPDAARIAAIRHCIGKSSAHPELAARRILQTADGPIACGYKDAIDLDRVRHDPLMKVAVGRCPITGSPLASLLRSDAITS